MQDHITQHLQHTHRLMADMLQTPQVPAVLAAAAQACIQSLRQGGTLFFAGNGGSAADAQHMAAEMLGRYAIDRPGLAAIALTTNSSVLTAIGNDQGYARVFSRQLQALGRAGDVFVGYSTSGQSANILEAFRVAKEKGLVCIGMTGNRGGPMRDCCDFLLEVPSGITPHIQEGHLVLGHILCGLVEQALFPSETSQTMKVIE
jgi:D-sedoheptulose 7-phosphate isomerase